jgi:DNA gyrase subunit A
MATNIPPHNLSEVISGCLAMIDNGDITVDELMEHIPGPDFPTAAIINGRAGIIQAYRTGRGRIRIRARAEVETNAKGRETIIISELPYQLNKARLIEKIAELVKEKKVEGISELRDESDKDGLRVVIEIKRGEMGDVVLNNLYAQTQLEAVFGINTVALVDGQPRILNLKELLEHFLLHRREVVTRRTVYLLRKARERGHILEGLAVAISNIDPVIAAIKASANTAEAREALTGVGWELGNVAQMLEQAGETACRPEDLPEQFGYRDGKYYLSPVQVQAILDLRLQKLTGMEHEKLIAEYQERLLQIAEYLHILGSSERLLEVIKEELELIREEFGDERRTEITASTHDLTVEDLIPEEDRVVTISHGGYAKTQPLSDYQAQRRGGTGKSATAVKDDDFVEHLLIASTHDTILCFSNAGKVYWLKVFHIPVAGRNARGRPVVNLLPLDEGERITSILPVSEYREDQYVVMATGFGTIKKTALTNFSRQRSSGLIAVNLDEGDALVGTAITNGEDDIMLISDAGKVVRFNETTLRPLGRTSRGVRGIKMDDANRVISLMIPAAGGRMLSVSENGYGKQTAMEDFPTKGRGNMGVIGQQCSDRNGNLVGAVQVFEGDELMLISNQGTMIRSRTTEISILSRNTQGVRLIRLKDGEKLVSVARIEEPDEDALAALEDEHQVAVAESVVSAAGAPDTAADQAGATDDDAE